MRICCGDVLHIHSLPDFQYYYVDPFTYWSKQVELLNFLSIEGYIHNLILVLPSSLRFPSSVGLIYRCMVFINIIYGIKKPIHGYQNCNTRQILIFGGMSRRENLCILKLLVGLIPF